MENQHRQIKGYRELSQDEIDTMNKIKALGAEVGTLIESLGKAPTTADPRWLAIAKTDLQKAFMALTRSVAKIDFF